RLRREVGSSNTDCGKIKKHRKSDAFLFGAVRQIRTAGCSLLRSQHPLLIGSAFGGRSAVQILTAAK
ncbi:MAG: hypothetical protein IJO88_08595, partial [Oscillospiraceae bacterium]|nr:hypothetical protein [Oscillospiraceae bacterium]